MRVDGRCEDVIFFDGVFFEPSLKRNGTKSHFEATDDYFRVTLWKRRAAKRP